MACWAVTISDAGRDDDDAARFETLDGARSYAREYRDFHVAEGCTSRGAIADGRYVITDADRCGAHGATVVTVVAVARVDECADCGETVAADRLDPLCQSCRSAADTARAGWQRSKWADGD